MKKLIGILVFCLLCLPVSAHTFASANTSYGNGALAYVTVGIQNTAVGKTALFSVTEGISNTAFGANALLLNQTGSNNTAIGTHSLLNVLGEGNTAIGSQSGMNLKNGSYNILIGFNAETVDASGKIIDGSNQLNIGNSIYGDLATKRIGIGTPDLATGSALTVGGNTTVRGGLTATGLIQTFGDIEAEKNLSIGGTSHLFGDVTSEGAITTKGSLTVTEGKTDLKKGLSVSGGDLEYTGTALKAYSAQSNFGSVAVGTKDSSATAKFWVVGDSKLDGDLRLFGSKLSGIGTNAFLQTVTIGAKSDFTGVIKRALNVTGDAGFTGGIAVDKDARISGDTTIKKTLKVDAGINTTSLAAEKTVSGATGSFDAVKTKSVEIMNVGEMKFTIGQNREAVCDGKVCQTKTFYVGKVSVANDASVVSITPDFSSLMTTGKRPIQSEVRLNVTLPSLPISGGAKIIYLKLGTDSSTRAFVTSYIVTFETLGAQLTTSIPAKMVRVGSKTASPGDIIQLMYIDTGKAFGSSWTVL